MENKEIAEGYYFVNNSKKILYHNKGNWYKPAYSTLKKFAGYYNTPLTTKIKTFRELTIEENKRYF